MGILFTILKGIWSFLQIFVYLGLLLIVPFIFGIIFFLVKGVYIDKRVIPKSKVKKVKKIPLVKRLFFLAPKQFAEDIFNRDPEFFKEQGMIIFTGMQGSGKTISMVEYISRLIEMYSGTKCMTNFAFMYENKVLKHWTDLIDYKNGIKGVVIGIDELQNWFSSRQSRDFPPEMLEVITQNRKNRRLILGTAQSFYMLSKDIRTQCTELRKCFTFCGCITVVVRKRPICDNTGDIKEMKHLGMYMYVHTPELRKSYDTYKVIESLRKSGFKERMPDVVVNNIVPKSKK